MSVTVVSICNSALIKVGSDRISSITQDTPRAIALNAIFTVVRDEVLRDHPWNFAIKRATLSPTSDTPAFEYDYEFDIPSDCIRMLEAYPPESDIDFVVEGRKILSNESELDMRYIYRNESPDQWDSSFAEALAWRLARELAYRLAQSSALVQLCDEGYKRALDSAKSADGAEGILRGLTIDSWTGARR